MKKTLERIFFSFFFFFFFSLFLLTKKIPLISQVVFVYTLKLLNGNPFFYTPFIYKVNRLISLVGRVFTNGPRDLGSILGRIIPKTLKMVLDTSLINIQQYKVCIKGKVEQSSERSSALPSASV